MHLCVCVCVWATESKPPFRPSLPHLEVSYPDDYGVFPLSTCAYRLHSPKRLVYIRPQQKHNILKRRIRRHKRPRQNHPDTHRPLFRFSLADRPDITTVKKRCESVPGCLGDFFFSLVCTAALWWWHKWIKNHACTQTRGKVKINRQNKKKIKKCLLNHRQQEMQK